MRNSTASWDDAIIITGARENNLKDINLQIPKNKFILVTGVSGSGKSSLVHDVIASEGKRRFLEQQNPRIRTVLAGIHPPDVDKITGMSPVISLDQLTGTHSIRSSIGTFSGLYDHLRLLFSRYGLINKTERSVLSRSHFSFNLAAGACEHCQGLGEEEYIDPDTFIDYPEKSLLNGALSLTTPTGYVIYSQVTLDVLETVCHAEGFSINKPWDQLSEFEKDIIFYGSTLLKVPFGKHTLESRMKWTGITAKPRDEGYYRGILTIMEEILKRDRNANILKYTKSRRCPVCEGYRLKRSSLDVKWQGRHIGEWAELSVDSFAEELSLVNSTELSGGEREIINSVIQLSTALCKLGLGYLSLNRESRSLSGGESKRVKLASLLQSGLSGLIYTLDEPTVGLHPADHNNLLSLLKDVQQKGNTIVCIDHKFFSFQQADYWIEFGPEAGFRGGEIVVEGYMTELVGSPSLLAKSQTWEYFSGIKELSWTNSNNYSDSFIEVISARAHNLKSISLKLRTGALNVICGVSGAGKSSLLYNILQQYFNGSSNVPVDKVIVPDPVKQTIWIDQAPIGRTPRSNPATYTKLFDKIRDLYASLPEAKEAGFTKSNFSFNVEGGRCPACLGAGKIEIGLSYLGKTEAPCDTCLGKRFKPEILEVLWRGKNIAQILDLEIDQAVEVFFDHAKILKYLVLLRDMGLGYIKLGQSSSSLSGGEAQRIKLVAELIKGRSHHCLYLLDEPSNGLHYADIAILLRGFEKLVEKGSTLVLVEHDPYIIQLADWIIELGPGAGVKGGEVVFQGMADSLLSQNSLMARSIHESNKIFQSFKLPSKKEHPLDKQLVLKGVNTNNLQNIDIEIPHNRITVITGVSGSGKTSLAFDTILASSNYLFAQSFSPYVRSLLGGKESGEVKDIQGLLPAIGIRSTKPVNVKYSTIATLLGISSSLRLLFSRFSVDDKSAKSKLWANHFSFLHPAGACSACHGLGYQMEVKEEQLINNQEVSLLNGAMKGSRTGAFFSEPKGQYMAILQSMASKHQIEIQTAWRDFSETEKDLILFGTGDIEYSVEWKYQRKNLAGKHIFNSKWLGFIPLIQADYQKKAGTSRQKTMEDILSPVICSDCQGFRIQADRLKYTFLGKSLADWLSCTISDLQLSLSEVRNNNIISRFKPGPKRLILAVLDEMEKVLSFMMKLGLGYLSLNRSTHSLSAGEYQRTRLAGQLVSGLNNILFILDEPSNSLHPANLKYLQEIFAELVRQQNAIIFTDHNPWLIEQADSVIELGPGGGKQGGQIIHKYRQKNNSNTMAKGEFKNVARPDFLSNVLFIRMRGVAFRNLNIECLDLPLGWISICGVSGSGKSTLLNDVIATSLVSGVGIHCEEMSITHDNFTIIDNLNTGIIWNWYRMPIRELGLDTVLFKCYSDSDKGREYRRKPAYFKRTSKGGRCESCQGRGFEKTELDFLGTAVNSCVDCSGTGYNKTVSEYTYNQRMITECMLMTLSEILDFLPDFQGKDKARRIMSSLGLGYLIAGQHGHKLSPGERQRLVLMRQLLDMGTEKKVILFDEPGQGLDAISLRGYCELMRDLASQGNMIISIDHDQELISKADWIIELGPGAGDNGGRVVFAGSPDNLVKDDVMTATAAAIKDMDS